MLQLRFVSLISFLSGLLLLSSAYYLQWTLQVAPCPLCLLQRLVFALLTLLFLMATAFSLKSTGTRRFGFAIISLSVIGFIIALRQIWLQHLPPDQQPPCGASVAYMAAHFPWHQTVLALIQGAGDCSEIVWRFAGLSIPEWSAICFSLYIVIGAYFVGFAKRKG